MADDDQEPIPYSTGAPDTQPTAQPPVPPVPPASPPAKQDDPLAGIDIGKIYERQQDLLKGELEARRRERPPPLPRQERIPPAPQHDIRGDAMTWLGFASAIGGLAGAMSRGNSIAALNAFSGTLDGLRSGDQQRFEDQFRTWESNAKALQENNKMEMDQYRNILERQDLDHRQRADMLEIQARMNRNEFMLKLAQAAHSDPTIMAAALDSITNFSDKADDSLSRIIEYRQQRKQAHEDALELERVRQQGRIEAAQQRLGASMEGPEAIDDRVDMALQGNMADAVRGLRAGTPNESAFRNRLAEVANERNITPEMRTKLAADYKGAMVQSQTLGRYAARAETSNAEVAQAIKPALDASDRVPRGKWVPWNDLVNNWRRYSSDPLYADLVAKTITLKNVYVRAMNPTSNATVQARKELDFDNMFALANSQAAYETQLRAVMLEVQLMGKGVEVAKGNAPPPPNPFEGRPNPIAPRQLSGGITGGGKAASAPGPARDYSKMSDDELRQELGIQ